MKQKIFKILTGLIFSVFVLTLFNFATVKAETKVTTRLDANGATITDVTETTYENRKDQTSGFGSGYITTREEVKSYYNYKGDGTDEQYGETSLTESYYDNNGDVQTQSGSISYDDNGQLKDNWGNADGGNFNGSTYEYSSSGSNKFTYTLLQSLPNTSGGLKENVTLKDYLTWTFRFTLALAGFLAVMMIVIGGVEYIISGANEKMRGEAHGRITNAIYGLVLALVAYLVLYTINPSLVDFKNNSFFKAKETTTSSNSNNNNTDNTSSSYASDNPYINKGESTTKLEQSSSAGSDQNNNGINDKFENPTGTTKNSQFQGTMNGVE